MSATADAGEQATIQQYCKALRTPTIGGQFAAMAEQAQAGRATATRGIWKPCWPWKLKNGNATPWPAGFKRLSFLDEDARGL